MSIVSAKLSRDVSRYLPLQLLLVGEGDGMDEEVEPAPALADRREGGVEAGVVGHVAGHDEIAAPTRLGQRAHPLAPAPRPDR